MGSAARAASKLDEGDPRVARGRGDVESRGRHVAGPGDAEILEGDLRGIESKPAAHGAILAWL